MKIMSKSRQVPKEPKIISQKCYHDILYCHLQAISQVDPDTQMRYVGKENLKYTKLGAEIGLTRQTVSTRMKNLVEIGLIDIDENKTCWLVPLRPKDAFLLPIDTVKLLISLLSDNAINTYVYLINRYYANNEQPFDFTINCLKANCGLSTKSKSNNYIIDNILFGLKQIGLIDYTIVPQEKKEDGEYKTIHHLKWASNIVQKKC